MIRIREIDHAVLRVSNPAAMLRFYCDVLGMDIERRDDDAGLIQLRAGRSLLDLVPVDSPLGRAGGGMPDRAGRNLDHLCFRIDPFDAGTLAAHLEACGVTPGDVHERYGAEGYGPSMYISDPEGNTIELKGPPGPGGA